MADKRVVVTGAGGFIGRWSIPPLVAAGYDVHAIVSPAAGRDLPPQLRGARLHYVDLLDAAPVDALLRAVKPDHLLHFAWMATPGVYWTSPDNGRWLAAGEHLVERFHAYGGQRAVMAGTCAEYDWSRVGVCNERTSPLADGGTGATGGTGGTGVTAYARSKLAMQRQLAAFGTAHAMSTAWGRIFFQFGPGEHPERLVASVITRLLSGRAALCTHGRQIRSFLHVADVGAAFAALLDGRVEGAVNIGSAERITIAALLDSIALQIGRAELLQLGSRSASPTEPPLLVPDISRLRNEVNWRPSFNLQDGLADTIAWWRARLQHGVSAADG